MDGLERFVSTQSCIFSEDLRRSSREFRLDRGERSIMGYFPSSTRAQKALQEIKNLGFETAQMDRVSLHGDSANPDIDRPRYGRDSSQAGLSLDSSGALPDASRCERVIPAAHPSVSGMASYDFGAEGGESFLVTVVADSAHTPEVVQIIRDNGGSV